MSRNQKKCINYQDFQPLADRLTLLKKTDSDYQRLHDIFKAYSDESKRKTNKIQWFQAYRINDEKRMARFIEAHKRANSGAEIKLVFHGSKTAPGTVALTGYDISKVTTALFGRGIYFATNPYTSIGYSCYDKKRDVTILLANYVLLSGTDMWTACESGKDCYVVCANTAKCIPAFLIVLSDEQKPTNFDYFRSLLHDDDDDDERETAKKEKKSPKKEETPQHKICKIHEVKKVKGVNAYRVEWCGYPNETDWTYEPRRNIQYDPVFKQFTRRDTT